MAKAKKTFPARHWSVVLLRIFMGWYFLYAGWSKVVTYFTPAKDWTATGFLMGVEGPFKPFFASMVNSPIIDYLNAYGLLLIGVAVMFGLLVRFASLWGAVLMFLYWMADFPPEHGFIIDDHLILMWCFIVFATVDAGRTLGLDGWLESQGYVKKHPILKMFLG